MALLASLSPSLSYGLGGHLPESLYDFHGEFGGYDSHTCCRALTSRVGIQPFSKSV